MHQGMQEGTWGCKGSDADGMMDLLGIAKTGRHRPGSRGPEQ